MSSSDLTSDKVAESNEIGANKEDLDSIDASLDAILSEAKEVAPPTLEPLEPLESHEASSPAEEADTVIPPPADIQISLHETATGSDVLPDSDGAETPLPVIVEEEEPSYKAFADMVAPTEEPRVEAAPPAEISVAAPSAEPESGEILDADALIDSMTPAPEPAAIEAAEAAAAELARTEESQAFTPPSQAFTPSSPPSDEEILDHVKLPPGATPMPLVATTASSEVPGSALGDDDQTVISPMPPIPEPATLPPPRAFGSAWGAPPPVVSDQTPSILVAREGLGTKIRKAAASRVQTSVAVMAFVVIGSVALGAAVMRAASPTAPAPSKVVVAGPAPAKAEPAHQPDIAPLPTVATPAPAPAEPVKAAVAEKTEKAEKPAPAKPAPAKAKTAAAQGTHIALAAPAAKAAAPAKAKPAPAPAKPKKAAGGSGWVDPFGQ